MIIFKKNILLAIVSLMASVNSMAGSVDGPYVVWVNLSKNPAKIDERIRNYLNSGESLCWNSEALMFMRSKPSAITTELISSAIIKHNKKSIEKLNGVLKKPFNDANDGFDGIIVYTDKPTSKYYSLTTGQTRVVSQPITLDHLEQSICIVMPEIVRKP